MKLNNFLSSKQSDTTKSLKFPQLNDLPSPSYPSQSTLRSLEGKSSSTARSLNNTSAIGVHSGNLDRENLKKNIALSIDKVHLSNLNIEANSLTSIDSDGAGLINKFQLANDSNKTSKLTIPRKRLLKRQDSRFKSLQAAKSGEEKVLSSTDDNFKNESLGNEQWMNKKKLMNVTSQAMDKSPLDHYPNQISIFPKNKKSNSTPTINDSYLRAVLSSQQPSPTQENFLKSFRKINEYESKQLGLGDYNTVFTARKFITRPSSSIEYLSDLASDKDKQSKTIPFCVQKSL
jgi:anti-anti-sigma regulatory factor